MLDFLFRIVAVPAAVFQLAAVTVDEANASLCPRRRVINGFYLQTKSEDRDSRLLGGELGERRLAAVMFTDIANYTSLSRNNEVLALSLLEEHRQLLRPIFAKHGGREVKTMGDAFLVEFLSALEAVRCAVEIQQDLVVRNLTAPSGKRLQLRVAVHLGDVEHKDGDVYGDAVNIASRIHAFVEPGEICITEQVFDHIQSKKEFRTLTLGKRELKNVQMPLEIYKVLLPGEAGQITESIALEPRRVAALPLNIIGSDPQDEYFADGLTEEIINTLSSISGLRVIARTSVMKYKGVNKSIGEIGRELKVGTILEGSVRKASGRLRITVQLIDAESEEPIWAQKYDRGLDDIFAIQAEIAERVAEALKAQLLKEGIRRIERRAPENFQAYALYLQGRYHWNKRNQEGLKKAIEYFSEAIREDPNYALAYAGMADCYTLMGRHRYLPGDEAFSRAREFVNRSLEIDDRLAEAHASLAAILINSDRDWKGAEGQFRLAVELNPNYATARYWYSVLLLTLGRLESAVEEAEKAQLLDPLSPVIGMGVVQAYLFSERYDKAIDECRRYLDMNPNFVPTHDFLVHLFVHKGMFDEAIREAQRMIDLSEIKAEGKAHLAYAYVASGKTEEARRMIREAIADPKVDYSNPTMFITVYSILGDQDRAFEWAEKVFKSERLAFPTLRFSPDLKNFRDDERYRALLMKAGLELYM